MTHYLDTGKVADYNEAFVAIIQADISYISNKFGLPIIEDYDDLDYFKAIDLYLADGFSVQLCRYRGEPENHLNIFFQSQLIEWKSRLQQVINFLELQDENIIQVNDNYFNTP